MKLRRKLKHFLALLLVFVMTLTNWNGVGTVVHAAAGESELVDRAENVKVTYAINHSNGDQTLYPWEGSELPVVTYGDTLYFELAWNFVNGDNTVSTADVFTYTLPDLVKVADVKEHSILDTNNTVVGKYSITNNVIKVHYTDDKFCGRDNKNSYITFQGSINMNKNKTQDPADVEVIFPNATKMTFKMKPSDIESEIYVHKMVYSVDPSRVPAGTPDADKNYIYRSKIRFTSKGNNDEIVFDDEMWPGMTLYSDPVFYSDVDLENEITGVDYGLQYTLPGGTTIHAKIPHMGNLDQIWVSYLVKIDPAMYSMDTANEYLKDHDPKEYYPNRKYTGKVSNKATVTSKDDPVGYHSWGSVYTIGGGIDKWANPSKHKTDEGKLNWEITLNSIKRPNYSEGYLIDILPPNVSLVNDKVDPVVVRDVNTYNIIEDAVDIKVTSLDDGSTQVRYDFKENLLKHLKTSEETKAVIIYYTKIDRQEEASKTYTNKASVYYNKGTDPVMEVEASDTYIKPNALEKDHNYTRITAPNAEFTVEVNSAALDLDPDVEDLILEDTMSDSYSLVVDSVLINGEKPEKGVFEYIPESRLMRFNLKDSTAYKIEYEARVTLKKDSALTSGTDGNSKNDVKLYAVKPGTYSEKISHSFDSVVFSSSAGASSDEKATLNITKYKEGEISTVLNGAEFTLTKMNGTSDVTASTQTVKAVTGGDDGTGEAGTAVFGGLERGVVYMLEETKAPENYVLDSTPKFYAFAKAGTTLPSTITYENKSYTLNSVDDSKSINDDYISNARKTADLEVAKSVVDTDGKSIANSGSFEVTLKDSKGGYLDANGGFTADADTAVYKTVTTSASCKFENLPIGEEYTVVEKTPAASIKGYSYTGNDAGAVTIAESDNKVTVTNNYSRDEGTLVLEKTFVNEPSKLTEANITFTVTGPAAFNGGQAATVTYDQFTNGTYSFGKVPVGDYTVTEFIADSEKTVTDGNVTYTFDASKSTANLQAAGSVAKGKTTTLSIENAYEKTVTNDEGTLKLKKVFVDAPSGLDGSNITFTVLGPVEFNGGAPLTVTYDQFTNGEYSVGTVPVGVYTVSESVADSEKSRTENEEVYTFDADGSTVSSSDSVIKDGETTLTITNKYTKTGIEKDEGTLVLEKSFTNAPEDLVKSNITFTVSGPADFNSGSEFVVGYDAFTNGQYDFGKVPAGTYTVTETVASSEQSKSTEDYIYTFAAGSSTMTASGDVTKDETTTLALSNVYDKTEIIKEGTLVLEKTFENEPADLVKANLTFKVEGPDGFSKEVSYADFTNGKYTIENVTVGTYTVTETIADSEKEFVTDEYTYTFNADDSTVNLKSTGNVEKDAVTTLTINNVYDKTVTKKEGTLVLEKTFVNEPTNLEKSGLTFTVIGPAEFNGGKPLTVSYADFTDGKYTIGNVPVGTYTVIETIADSEMKKVDGTVKYTFNASSSTKDLKSTGDVAKDETTTLTIKNAYDKEVITTTPQVGENTVETNVTNTNNDSKKPETPETPQSVTGTNTSNNTNTNNTTESKVVIKDTKKNTDTNVKTGDASGAMLGIMGLLSVISMAYIGLWLVLKRKKK